MTKTTILQVLPALNTGGAERTALDIGHAVSEAGWTSLITSGGGRLKDEAELLGSRHLDLPLNTKNPFTMLGNIGRIKSLIKTHNVDVIHARSRAPAWSAYFAAKQTGIPFVTTYHGAYNQQNWLKAKYNSVMARADVIIANSKWTADLIASRHPFAADRIVAISRGTDFSTFNRSAIAPERIERLRQQWGVNKDHIVFLHLARLTHWKGQKFVIDAAQNVVSHHPNARFVLAGDAQGRDDYLSGLKKRASDLGLQDHIILPGHCDDPAAAMAVADIVVVASIEAEAFGRAAVEAGALGKPVLVTKIGAVVETVRAEPEYPNHEISGWKVEPGNAQEMGAVMNDILSMSPQDREQVGQQALQFVTEHFSLKQMSEKTMAVYRQLLGSKTKID